MFGRKKSEGHGQSEGEQQHSREEGAQAPEDGKRVRCQDDEETAALLAAVTAATTTMIIT